MSRIQEAFQGKKAFIHHARFHKEMITSILDEFDEDEKKILIRGLTKLDNWFRDKEEENKKSGGKCKRLHDRCFSEKSGAYF